MQHALTMVDSGWLLVTVVGHVGVVRGPPNVQGQGVAQATEACGQTFRELTDPVATPQHPGFTCGWLQNGWLLRCDGQ